MTEQPRPRSHIGDHVSFKGDFRERMTGRVIDLSIRKGSQGRNEVRLTITGKDGKLYIRAVPQVKPVS